MPPRALVGEHLGPHEPFFSVQVGPQRGFARWLYTAAHLPLKAPNQSTEGPQRERGEEAVGLKGARREIEEEAGKEEKEKGGTFLLAALVPQGLGTEGPRPLTLTLGVARVA